MENGLTPCLIGYARVSPADQSPQLQIDALVEAGVPAGRIHQEKDRSDGQRPQFEAMLRQVIPGDTVVVWKLDRLGRSVRQVLATIHLLAARGVQVRVLVPDIDTGTPAGRGLLTMLATVAELERDLIRERTAAGLAAARVRARVGGARRKMTDEQVMDARQRLKKGEMLSDLARELKVSSQGLSKRLKQLERPRI